jgi:hypothetical protein
MLPLMIAHAIASRKNGWQAWFVKLNNGTWVYVTQR